eukprot:CAMPEP_0178984190 /NCGR_PEP_ID=MMETSP0795-20121207/1466_1 /TAXON_ID=88552 /ORGANISM="Amoebophrya sp., Strain Ameob2" /LENGTH=644 /DNA_ID=CAMNT_0020675023 /DNA_START=86 /DNA_END=2021 /DNA_ORIENTATION=-
MSGVDSTRFPSLRNFPRPQFPDVLSGVEGVPESLKEYFPDFSVSQWPSSAAIQEASFRDLLCYCYARNAKVQKTRTECEKLWKIVNVDLVGKYVRNKAQIDINELVYPGIPILHLICKVGQDAHKPHTGQTLAPMNEIPERNVLLETMITDTRLDVNALDLHGQSALAYSYSYTYETFSAPGTSKTKDAYHATCNWLNVRMLLLHPNFCALDFPVPAGQFFNLQIRELLRRSHCLFDERRQLLCEVYGPTRRKQLENTLNFCGSEMQRAKEERAHKDERVSDPNEYSMTLLTRILTKKFGDGPELFTCEPASVETLEDIWRHPAFDRTKFLGEVAAVMVMPNDTRANNEVKEIRWQDLAIGSGNQFANFFNCTRKALDYILQAIHLERKALAAGSSSSPGGGTAQPSSKAAVTGASSSSGLHLPVPGAASSSKNQLPKSKSAGKVTEERRAGRRLSASPRQAKALAEAVRAPAALLQQKKKEEAAAAVKEDSKSTSSKKKKQPEQLEVPMKRDSTGSKGSAGAGSSRGKSGVKDEKRAGSPGAFSSGKMMSMKAMSSGKGKEMKKKDSPAAKGKMSTAAAGTKSKSKPSKLKPKASMVKSYKRAARKKTMTSMAMGSKKKSTAASSASKFKAMKKVAQKAMKKK